MTDPTLTYVIIGLGTLALLALRYYRHVRQERDYFDARKPPSPPPE